MAEEKFLKAHYSVLQRKDLKAIDKLVYSYLLNRYQYWNSLEEQFYCYEKNIVKDLGSSKSTIIKSISRLEDAGIIKKKPRIVPNTNITANYYNVKSPEEISNTQKVDQ